MDKFMHFVEDKMSPIRGTKTFICNAKRFYDSIAIDFCWSGIYGYC